MISQLKFPALNLFLIISSIIIGNTSLLGIAIPNVNVLTLVVIGLWYIEILVFERHLDIPYNILIILFVWWLYELMYHIVGISSAAIGNYYTTLRFFDIVIKSFFVLRFYCDKEKVILATIIYISIFATMIENLYYLKVYGEYYFDLFIQAAYTQENSTEINFASTAFYNSLIFFVGISFYKAIHSKSVALKLFHFSCLLLAFFFMLSIETRATSLLLSLFLIAAVYYLSGGSRSKKVVLIFIFAIALLTLPAWISNVIDILPDRVAVRLRALLYHNNPEDEEYLSRFKLMANSFNTFFSSNMLFGVGDHRGREYWHIIGQHSQIFDDLARYGLVGLFFIVKFFKTIYADFTKVLCSAGLKPIALSSFIVFLILCVNSQAYSSAPGMTAFLLMSTIIPKNTDSI